MTDQPSPGREWSPPEPPPHTAQPPLPGGPPVAYRPPDPPRVTPAPAPPSIGWHWLSGILGFIAGVLVAGTLAAFVVLSANGSVRRATASTMFPLAPGTSPVPTTRAAPSTTTTTTRPSPLPSATTIPGDGVFFVGEQVQPGRYRADSGADEHCFWSRLKGFSGAYEDVIDTGMSKGQAIVDIRPTDAGFQTSFCGEWTKIG
jgi:hypothetical protein